MAAASCAKRMRPKGQRSRSHGCEIRSRLHVIQQARCCYCCMAMREVAACRTTAHVSSYRPAWFNLVRGGSIRLILHAPTPHFFLSSISLFTPNDNPNYVPRPPIYRPVHFALSSLYFIPPPTYSFLSWQASAPLA